jgi:hypothetical protein
MTIKYDCENQKKIHTLKKMRTEDELLESEGAKKQKNHIIEKNQNFGFIRIAARHTKSL